MKRGKFRAAAALLALLMLCVLPACGTKQTGEPEASPTAEPGLALPYALENGALEVTSIFQYSGANPDCGNEMGENIAAIELVNRSERYFMSAQVTASFADGTERIFRVQELPAGQTVWAFAVDNGAYDPAQPCVGLTCTAEFGEPAPLEEQVSVSVDGTAVALTNRTDAELTDLTVTCHTLFEEAYFGGIAYSYPVERLPANGQANVQAEACYLGSAAVVRISNG